MKSEDRGDYTDTNSATDEPVPINWKLIEAGLKDRDGQLRFDSEIDNQDHCTSI